MHDKLENRRVELVYNNLCTGVYSSQTENY